MPSYLQSLKSNKILTELYYLQFLRSVVSTASDYNNSIHLWLHRA